MDTNRNICSIGYRHMHIVYIFILLGNYSNV